MENPPLRSRRSDAVLREAMARRLYRRSVVTGEITLPAVPGMIDEYVTMCDTLFAGVGRRFTAEQLAHVRTVLEGQLAEAYAASPRSTIVISFNAPVGTVLNYHVKPQWWTVEGAYENWISHPRAATVWYRTGCSRVGAGERSSRSHDASGARYRRRNRAQRAGLGAPRPPGRRGRDDPEVRRHDSLRRRTGITRRARHPA